MAEPLHVVIDDDTETVIVDPVTGTIEERQPDGGVVVHLDAKKQGTDEDDDDDGWFGNLADKMDRIDLASIANELPPRTVPETFRKASVAAELVVTSARAA